MSCLHCGGSRRLVFFVRTPVFRSEEGECYYCAPDRCMRCGGEGKVFLPLPLAKTVQCEACAGTGKATAPAPAGPMTAWRRLMEDD